MIAATSIVVGMADIKVSRDMASYACLGLGSCVGIFAYDRSSMISGAAHVMLPESFPDRVGDSAGKFANSAVPELLRQMVSHGADRSKIVCAICGGAQVFRFSGANEPRLDIGARNCTAVIEQLSKVGIKCVAQDLGGSVGRSVVFSSETGDIKVRTVGSGEKALCNLKR